METVGISNFIQTHTNPKVFNGDWSKLRDEVEENLASDPIHLVKPGYRKGVILVSVLPTYFRCPVVKLKEGERFKGIFRSRIADEEPRKSIFKDKALDEIPSAKKVNIILYHRDVLLETNEEITGADWDMISVQALDSEESAPMDPTTLMYNHFQLSGGTPTHMSAEEFEKALKESFAYWRDRIIIK